LIKHVFLPIYFHPRHGVEHIEFGARLAPSPKGETKDPKTESNQSSSKRSWPRDAKDRTNDPGTANGHRADRIVSKIKLISSAFIGTNVLKKQQL
jgi:hypothetical protein